MDDVSRQQRIDELQNHHAPALKTVHMTERALRVMAGLANIPIAPGVAACGATLSDGEEVFAELHARAFLRGATDVTRATCEACSAQLEAAR